MDFFNKNNTEKSLEQDRAWTESLINKESLSEFAMSKSTAPNNYFESFPEKLMNRIKNENSIEKEKSKIFYIPSWLSPINKWAVAAIFLLMMGVSFIFLNNSISNNKSNSLAHQSISLEELSNEEIETYVDANEWISEIDTQTQLLKENNKLNFLADTQIEEIKKIITE